MPSCKKTLTIFKNNGHQKMGRPLTEMRCVQGENHNGKCEFHLWTNGKNTATGDHGIMVVIHMER